MQWQKRSSLGVMAAALLRARSALADPPRTEFSLEGGIHGTIHTSYVKALESFNYRQDVAWGFVNVRGFTLRPIPWLALGAIAGYQRLSFDVQTGDEVSDGAGLLAGTSPTLSGPLVAHIGHVGFALRSILRERSDPRALLRGDAELNVGVAFVSVHRAEASQFAVLPRLALSFMVGAAATRGILVGVRLGVQYIPWNIGGGGFLTPTFVGVSLGFEFGARL